MLFIINKIIVIMYCVVCTTRSEDNQKSNFSDIVHMKVGFIWLQMNFTKKLHIRFLFMLQ